ncbi:MAG TPA: PrsW family glutamic-type intramembrane protease [Candidatus Paceibacterota bacterium]
MAQELGALQLFFILCAGILPPLVWLWYWLREDTRRPEPRKLLVITFFFGAAIVLIPVLPLQALANNMLPSGVFLLLVWAFIEEISKFGVAFFVDFRNKSYNEPIDAMIYLITIALGFAAFENTLFIFKELNQSGVHISIITALIRFIGATLLHVCSSATIGSFVALSYCRSLKDKILFISTGVILATVIHTLFNFFILSKGTLEGSGGIISVFSVLWIGVICLLLFFEKVKQINCKEKIKQA